MCIETHRDFPAGELLTLRAADGSEFGAFHARAAAPSGGRLVLLPDMGGLRGDYVDLARHFTETGCEVLAIDYYGRTAGVGPHAADMDHAPHMAEAGRENVLVDIAAAISYLDTLGSGADLAGVVAICPWTGSYGRSEALPDDFVDGLRVPMLGLFGGADTEVPVSVPEFFEARLTEAGKPHEIVIYPGQPHGFYEWHHLGRSGHKEAADDAFKRLMAFTNAR
jgi:carboxymethylenebutenolidase